MDLYVNERQTIYYTIALGLLKKGEEKRKKKKKKNANSRCVRKLRYYSYVIHSFDCKSAIEHDGGV